METFAEIIIIIASIPVLVTGIYAFIKFKQLGPELRAFSYFLFLSFFIEVISKIMWFMSLNNYPLLHIYVAVGFPIQVWFYHEILKKFLGKKLIVSIAILFTCFTVANSAFFQDIYTFNSNALTVQSILIIIFSISTYMLFLNDIVKRETDITLIKSLSWINSGLFTYYSSSLLIFYLGDYFTKNYSVTINQYTWMIHTMFLIFMYSCFLIGLNKSLKKA